MENSNKVVSHEGYKIIQPIIITKEASKFIEFLKYVFNGVEIPEARVPDYDGLLLHSEVKIGDSMVIVGDRKPDWPFTPSLLQIYVSNVNETLKKAEEMGAEIVTKPTLYIGSMFARIKDKWGNVWWIYEYVGEVEWSQEDDSEEISWEPTEESNYIHSTLLETMRNLKDSK